MGTVKKKKTGTIKKRGKSGYSDAWIIFSPKKPYILNTVIKKHTVK